VAISRHLLNIVYGGIKTKLCIAEGYSNLMTKLQSNVRTKTIIPHQTDTVIMAGCWNNGEGNWIIFRGEIKTIKVLIE